MTIEQFRGEARQSGRDPADVEINIQILDAENFNKLKEYRDIGIQRATIGVSVDMWNKPEQIIPMIDRFAQLIPELTA